MDLDQYLRRLMAEVEGIHGELEQLRILAEYELDVRIEHADEGHGPYVVPNQQPADEE